VVSLLGRRVVGEPVLWAFAPYRVMTGRYSAGMEDRMKALFVFAFIFTLTIPALAQTPATPLRDAARREVVHGSRTLDTATSQATQVPRRNWAARHPVLTGTFVGAGLGFPIGAATCNFPTAEGSSCDDYTHSADVRLLGGLTIGLYGAGIGAGVGALIGVIKR
jgi:hypothetical protein